MTREQVSSAQNMPQPREWVQSLSPVDRAEYYLARQENIDEMLPAVRILIDKCLPRLKNERPDEFEATAFEWAKSCRDTYEDGMQAGKDAWGNSSDPDVRNFMRNSVRNWAV